MSQSRPSLVRLTRNLALTGPLCLLAYGLLRLVDGLDGSHGPGVAWDVGHAFFLAAFLTFGVLLVALRDLVPVRTPAHRATAVAAMLAGLVGVAAFLRVILGDLFPRLDGVAELPAVLEVAGPLLFQVGTVGLLAMLATLQPRRVPWWSPVLVFAGFLPIAVNLDLLPVAALMFLVGLSPLHRDAVRRDGGPSSPGRDSSWSTTPASS